MANSKALRYADYEKHFRTHYRDTYGSHTYEYSHYEPAYRSGFRYGTSDEYAGRSFTDLEPDMRRSYEKKHGEGTWADVKEAARHAFQRGRSHRTGTGKTTRSQGTHTQDDVQPKSPSGSGETASGGPGSAMREGGFDTHREAYRRHHKETYGEGERDFRDRIPAYRHGHRFGTSSEHKDRKFGDLEPKMRRSYEKEHGKGTWAKVKDAVRHAFKRSRSSSSHKKSS